MPMNLKEMNERACQGTLTVDLTHGHEFGRVLLWCGDEIVAVVSPDQHDREQANAERLAHCWNHFDELVAALQAQVEACDEICTCGECGGCQMVQRHLYLLAKVRGLQ